MKFVVIDSAESWIVCSYPLSNIRWPRSVILRDLPLCGWVAVIPNCFHFVIIPLTVDCGIFSSEEISRLDLLHSWHPITVPRWNSLSSWECEVIGTAGINYLDGWVNTFGNIMYIFIYIYICRGIYFKSECAYFETHATTTSKKLWPVLIDNLKLHFISLFQPGNKCFPACCLAPQMLHLLNLLNLIW